jgi:hypothetical protein
MFFIVNCISILYGVKNKYLYIIICIEIQEASLVSHLEDAIKKAIMRRGRDAGVEEYKVEFAQKILKKGWSHEEICNLLDVTEDWLRAVEKALV